MDDGEPETWRTFVAVPLSDAVRASARELSDALQSRPRGDRVRWLRPESYHVTLRFLGDVDRDALPALGSGLGRELASHARFDARLAAVAGLPSTRQPRVVVLGLEPVESFAALAVSAERVLVAHGLEPLEPLETRSEGRRFRPHVTLGRVRDRAPSLAEAPVPSVVDFVVDEVVLYRSELRPSGAVYTPLERMSLAGSDHPSNDSLEEEQDGQDSR